MLPHQNKWLDAHTGLDGLSLLKNATTPKCIIRVVDSNNCLSLLKNATTPKSSAVTGALTLGLSLLKNATTPK